MTLVEIRRHKNRYWGPKGYPPQRLMQKEENRATTLRRVEITLQRGRSILLQTARWSGGRDFCRSFCHTHQNAQYIAMRFPPEYETFEAWLLFLSEMRRQCGLPADNRLHVIAERKGFRWKLMEIFSLIENAETKIFLFDEIERWPMIIIEDVQRAWNEYSRINKAPLLVLAGALQGGLFSNRVWLYDYSLEESLGLLRSSLQRELNPKEHELIVLSGGIPELVYALCWGLQNDSYEQAWLPITREIRSVIDLMGTQDNALERLFLLQQGGQPTLQSIDLSLSQAGLVRILLEQGRQVSRLRAPLISQILESNIT